MTKLRISAIILVVVATTLQLYAQDFGKCEEEQEAIRKKIIDSFSPCTAERCMDQCFAEKSNITQGGDLVKTDVLRQWFKNEVANDPEITTQFGPEKLVQWVEKNCFPAPAPMLAFLNIDGTKVDPTKCESYKQAAEIAKCVANKGLKGC